MSEKRPGEKIKMMSVDELLGVPTGEPVADIDVSLIMPFTGVIPNQIPSFPRTVVASNEQSGFWREL